LNAALAGSALQGMSCFPADPGDLAAALRPKARDLALMGFHGLESLGRRSSAYLLQRSRLAVRRLPGVPSLSAHHLRLAAAFAGPSQPAVVLLSQARAPLQGVEP